MVSEKLFNYAGWCLTFHFSDVAGNNLISLFLIEFNLIFMKTEKLIERSGVSYFTENHSIRRAKLKMEALQSFFK